jgi:hypothetical protein
MAERLLVTGGKDYADAERMAAYLEAIQSSRGIALLIHGGNRGADALADAWARAHGVPVQSCPADWKAHGKGAGPMRDTVMLVDHDPTLVLTFPGDRGTANLIKKARDYGLEIIGDGVAKPIACKHLEVTTQWPPRCRRCGQVAESALDE